MSRNPTKYIFVLNIYVNAKEPYFRLKLLYKSIPAPSLKNISDNLYQK